MISKLIKIFFLINLLSFIECTFLQQPDFTSKWYPLQSGPINISVVEVRHGLGEMPLLVDVQVKAVDGPNKGFIFPAIGLQPRDDDMFFDYSAVVYIYNEMFVKISAPVRANHNLGSIILTGYSPYWYGPNTQKSYKAEVRVRAWKASTLPPPDFSITGIQLEANSTNVNKIYVEKRHGLSEFPALTVVRTKLKHATSGLNGYMSDSVGSSLAVQTVSSTTNGYVIYGVSKDMFRVWVSSPKKACGCKYIFGGGDGFGISGNVGIGELELYAWKGPSVPIKAGNSSVLATTGDELDITVNTTLNDIFIRLWVESSEMPNSGFRFVGSGSASLFNTSLSTPCDYGGMLYSYSNTSIRYWVPGASSPGSVICIGSDFGGGRNCQSSHTGTVAYSAWIPDFNECTSLPCMNNGTCTNGDNFFTCNCSSGWAGQNCSIDIDECLSSPCLHGSCQDVVDGYTCHCETGWTGLYCDIDVDECSSSPCNNISSTCIDGVNMFTCVCTSGWTGILCENVIPIEDNNSDNGLVVGLTVGLLLPLLVLAGVVAYIYAAKRYRKGKVADKDRDNMITNNRFDVSKMKNTQAT